MEEKRTCDFRFQLFLFLLCRGNEKKKGKRSPKISRSSKKGHINYGNNKEYYFGVWIEQNDGREYMWLTLANNMLRIHSRCQKIWE